MRIAEEPTSDFPRRWSRRWRHMNLTDQAAPALRRPLSLSQLHQGPDSETRETMSSSASAACPEGSVNLAGPNVELVVSAADEDPSWLSELDTPTVVYQHDLSGRKSHCYERGHCPELDYLGSTLGRTFLENLPRSQPLSFVSIPNVGDEAAAYLRHILNRYDALPQALVFLHNHAMAWHATFDMPQRLQDTCYNLADGYRSLNEGPDFDADSHCIALNNASSPAEHALFSRHWTDVFQPELGPYPARVCIDCCAQFVVSRERLLRHPKRFYEQLLNIVLSGDTSMEYEWRMLFVAPEEVGVRKS